MTLSEAMESYLSAKSIISEILGFYITHDITVVDDRWQFTGQDLYWKLDDAEFEYCEEADIFGKFEEFTLFKIYSCTGDVYYGLFRTSLEIK